MIQSFFAGLNSLDPRIYALALITAGVVLMVKGQSATGNSLLLIGAAVFQNPVRQASAPTEGAIK